MKRGLGGWVRGFGGGMWKSPEKTGENLPKGHENRLSC